MKQVLLSAALALGVLGATAVPSFADQVSVTDTQGDAVTVSGSNVKNEFTFVSSGAEFFGSLTESLKNFSLIGASLVGATPVTFSVQAIPSGRFSTLNLDATGLIAGQSYTLTVATSGSGIFGGTLNGVSNVPLPASVALFGAALAGVGIVGFARKKALPAATA